MPHPTTPTSTADPGRLEPRAFLHLAPTGSARGGHLAFGPVSEGAS